jgi:hypothetical protein
MTAIIIFFSLSIQICTSKNDIIMSNLLRLESFPNREKNLALVISISAIKKEIAKNKQDVPKEAAKKELPWFDTKPIFKAKKYDFF